jgi:hypothetical protein
VGISPSGVALDGFQCAIDPVQTTFLCDLLPNDNRAVFHVPEDLMVHIQAGTQRVYVRVLNLYYSLNMSLAGGVWYRLTIRRQAGTVEVWLGGSLILSFLAPGVINPSGLGVMIGWGLEYNASQQFSFGGKLKQLVVRNGPAPDIVP